MFWISLPVRTPVMERVDGRNGEQVRPLRYHLNPPTDIPLTPPHKEVTIATSPPLTPPPGKVPTDLIGRLTGCFSGVQIHVGCRQLIYINEGAFVPCETGSLSFI